MQTILFGLFSAFAVLSALLAVTRKNAVASACWLVLMFFGLAAVYVLLEAYFVAVEQVLVYAGAIMVLFLFVIMLLDLRSSELRARRAPHLKVVGVILAGAVLAAVLHAMRDATDSPFVADRASVSLRRPVPAAPAPDPAAPLAPVPAAPAAPEPLRVALVGATPPADAGGKGARAWEGTFQAVDAPGEPSRTVTVTVAPAGPVAIALDGRPLPPAAWSGGPGDPLQTASVPVPGAPEGTVLEVAVRRGGLDDSPGGPPDGSAASIGATLFERWLLPFEIISLLLTGAIFGAVVLTKRRLS
jgi:NADH-quinone oxidoreductase subunit J